MKNRSQLLLLLFFVSGACGLTYEVVWTRLFVVVIGNTVFSVSAILSVFMAGLAIGSRLAGRAIDRRPVPLVRTYAALEAGIGLYNLILPLFIASASPVFGALYAAASDSFIVLTMTRLIIVLVLLILPATLMGATLPILIRFYVENISSVGTEAGRVYGANTWGAAVGTVLAGFILVPYAGVTVTLSGTATVNLLIALMAWTLARSGEGRPQISTGPEAETAGPRIILFAMLLSGLAALIDEVAWTRVLGLVVGPTTYAFSLMLASMIAGLGLGAAIGAGVAARRGLTLASFAWIELLVGMTSLAVIPFFGQLPIWVGRIVTKYVERYSMIQATEFLIFFALMLVPTTFLGMTFPIASRLYAKSNASLGTEVSAIYVFNTAGAILGSLIAGFLLIPFVGSQWALIAAALINTLAGIMLQPRSYTRLAAGLAVASAISFLPRWNAELMSSGAYKYAPYYAANADLESMLTSGRLVYYKEGATTTVSARRQRGNTLLAIDGKVDATDSGDMPTQKMLGHLPLLLTENAKNVAIIGLGSGVTAGAALQHPIQSLDVVEISPEVVEASANFKHVNHDALHDSRTRLIIGDGRNHLRYGSKQYDVIVSEPSNPWMSGMASLFSREFFTEALSRLTPKGIHCQWFHSYNMSTEDLRSIIRTFRSAFPHAQLWALNQNDFLLLGSPSKIEVSGPVVQQNFQRVAEDLKSISLVDTYSVTTLYLLEDDDLDTFAGSVPLNTDARPILEFHAPRFIYANTTDENYAALTSVHKKVPIPPYIQEVDAAVTPENHRHKGEMYLASDSFADAIAELKRALSGNPDDSIAWGALLKASRDAHTRPQAAPFVEQTIQAHPSTTVRLAAAEFYAQEGAHDKALASLNAVLEAEPKNRKALEKLADIEIEKGSAEGPASIERLLSVDPGNAKGLFHLASLRFYQQRFDEALQLVKQSLQADPSSPRARNLLAIVYGQTFQHDLADAEFRKAIHDFPEDWLSINNYGLYLLDRGKTAEAQEQFRSAINLNPENIQAYVGLGEALRQSGRVKEAQRWYRAALQLDPNQPVAKQYLQ